MINKLCVLFLGILILTKIHAQDVMETFNGTRILNGHSVETLKKNTLQFRIEHRFGNIAGPSGGVQNFFGFDQAADIRFAFEYGLSDDLMIGFGRSKGTGDPYNSLLDGFVKFRILRQNKAKNRPISLTVYAASTLTYQQATENISMVQSFPEFAHRFAYTSQINIARKFGERVSLAFMPTYVHRNYVNANDINEILALGGAFNVKITKELGIIGEYYHTLYKGIFDVENTLRLNNYNSLSAGLEWMTNGHNFKIVLTNSRGFTESQFIPYTYSNWLNNEFRLGFSITRNFKI